MRERERLLLGIDIGGTKAVVALGHANGEILAESRREHWTSGAWPTDLERLEAQSRELLRSAGVREDELDGLGLSAPGPLNPETGIVVEAPNLPGWRQVPVAERIGAAFGVPCRLENDANAAALAEWTFGAGQGSAHMLYLTMSTGVGGGLILNGELYRGAHFAAGEVGHIPIVPGGRTCSCGLRGCLEAYTSGAGIAARIREDIAAGRAPGMLERAGGDPDRVSARLWVEALRAGDAYARALKDDFVEHLAQGLAGLVIGLDPECIVLGTIIERNPDLFLDDLRDRVSERIWPVLRDVRIEAGALGPKLPAYAALCAAALT
ncbi:MAG: ROK family protein [Myxococcota bacterium]